MNYREVLSKAYSITAYNPIIWLFGLVLLGGFNLSFLNLFTFLPDTLPSQWLLSVNILPIIVVGIVGFLLLNAIKIIFVVTLHKNIHIKEQEQCALCMKKEKIIPFGFWYVQVLLASFITIFLTMVAMLSVNYLFKNSESGELVAVLANFVFLAIVIALLGTWNIFTTFFVILHDLSFGKAASLASDLITLQFRKVTEFVILLSALYAVAVLLSHTLLYFWQVQELHALVGSSASGIHLLISFVVLVWVSVNNIYFNVALLVFFDNAVKSLSSKESTSRLLPVNRVN